ncbi:cytokine receptor-like [Pararge aegeria]|uniref:cytokine receptor-like n=1 Tax=Pararge aegeria TaxID=116150 RepID=UPI0019CF62E5|nr:cytokine receptor-like [Pararge aegeria]
MADLTTRITRKFQLYIWCMVFISLPCLSAKCLNVDISVNLYPEGTLKIKYGEPLELFCVTDSNYSASDIHFINGRNNKNMDSDIVNSTTRRLYIAMPEKQLTTFYCRNNKTKKVCLARVLVDSPPSDVTDFNCISKNVDILNCSWTRQPSFSIIRYTLTYSVNTLPVNPPCVPTQIESTVYCVWKTNSMPRYRQQEETQFFDMTACNAVGCNSQNFTVDHFSIVKPDSPYELKILKYGTHSVYLEWKISHNIVDFLSCGVDHIIQYQLAKVDNGTHFRTVDTSNLPARNRTYRFHLMDLPYAHMQYDLRIYIKSKMAKSRQYWSDFAYKHFTTLSEEPMRPPTIISGAFDQYTRGNE